MLPVLALVGGAAFGLAWHGFDKRPASGADGAASAGSATTDGPPPQVILVTSLRDEGDTVRLAWIDPTGGQATFVVSEIASDDTLVASHLAPTGQTEIVITGLDPKAPQYCFRVLAVVDSVHTGLSAKICTPERHAP
ncbi:MAG TPA: hypothetical protein VH561_12990 [Micromonosporaceae bacterium]